MNHFMNNGIEYMRSKKSRNRKPLIINVKKLEAFLKKKTDEPKKDME